MRTKVIGLFIAISALILFTTGCSGVDLTLPVYEMAKDNEDNGNISVIMDDVKYKMLPELKWQIHPGDKAIGYAGSGGTQIIEASGDTAENFIFLKDVNRSEDKIYAVLYRTDRPIPEPSADSVNRIDFYENDMRPEESKKINNSVTDKTVIKELFDALAAGQRTSDALPFKDISISMTCYSDAVPGATYMLTIAQSDGKLVCGSYREAGFVEISTELLEKIAGHSIRF